MEKSRRTKTTLDKTKKKPMIFPADKLLIGLAKAFSLGVVGIWGALGQKFFINRILIFVGSSCFEKIGGDKKKNKAFLLLKAHIFRFGGKNNTHRTVAVYKWLELLGKIGVLPKYL